MIFNYDPTADAMYIKLSDHDVIESEEIRAGIVLDYDDAGNVTGIGILNASKHGSEPIKKAA